MRETLAQVSALGWVQPVEARLQHRYVDPQLLGYLIEVRGPGERFAELANVDEEPRGLAFDEDLLVLTAVLGYGAALEVHQFVGDCAPAFGLGLAT